MNKIAVSANNIYGKKIIEFFKTLGGKNSYRFSGEVNSEFAHAYFINDDGVIDLESPIKLKDNRYTVYDFSKIFKKFPYKAGDKVCYKSNTNVVCTILDISYNSSGVLQYRIKEDKSGVISHYPTNLMVPYKPVLESNEPTSNAVKNVDGEVVCDGFSNNKVELTGHMTIEQWRNLKPGDLVSISTDDHIYKVVSTGWEDMEEKDYEDENDYIIEVKDLFDCFEGQFIVRAHQTELFNNKLITKDVLKIASKKQSPYDFIDGYLYFFKTIEDFRKLNVD